MVFELKRLLDELRTDSKKIASVEMEVARIIESGGFDTVRDLFCVNDPQLKFYVFVIVEKKMKVLKEKNASLGALVRFVEECVYGDTLEVFLQRRLAKIYAQLGIFEWPNTLPSFFNVVIELMASQKLLGYLILENFLYLVRNSFEINEERRSELKRAVILGDKIIIELISRDVFIEETISIYAHLITILPVPVLDFAIVFERGDACVEKTLDLLLEAVATRHNDEKFVESLIKFSTKIEINAKMIECFILAKNSIYRRNLEMYSYVFKGLGENIYTFASAVQFWTHLFKKGCPSHYRDGGQHDNEVFFNNLATEVLLEVVRVVLTAERDDLAYLRIEDMENDILTLFLMISQNYPAANTQFLTKCSASIPRKYASTLIKANKNRRQLDLKDAYLRAYSLFLDEDSSCVGLIEYLDLKDKDTCRLVAQIIRRFDIESDTLRAYFLKIENNELADEVLVTVALKLGSQELVARTLAGSMDIHKAHRIFYILKHKPEIVLEHVPEFYSFFMRSRAFDRCFAIIGLIYKSYGNVPKEIFQKIYADIEGYSVAEVNYFVTDLLIRLDEGLQNPFVEKIFFRLIAEWKDAEEQRELCLATKSFLSVLELLVERHKDTETETKYTSIIIEFLQVPDAIICKRICAFYNKRKFQFDTERMVYYLLTCYNSFELIDQHNEIVGLLVECIKKDDGPTVFGKFNFDPAECFKIKMLATSNGAKAARTNIREMLGSIKGKPLSQLYQSTMKIQSQNLFRKSEKSERSDFDLDAAAKDGLF